MEVDDDGKILPCVGDIISIDGVEYLAQRGELCYECMFDMQDSYCSKVNCHYNDVHFILNPKRNE